MKEFLSQAGRAFLERNVDVDTDAYDALVARGWRTVPLTFVGDATVRGFDQGALQAALDRSDVDR